MSDFGSQTSGSTKRSYDEIHDSDLSDISADEEPEQDFRQIPVVPTIDEIFDYRQRTIASNIIVGQYKDVDHYLDIHYRLLRLDFVRPLRTGIKQYIDGTEGRQRCKESPKHLYLWKRQNCQNVAKTRIWINFWATFDVSDLQHIDWKVFFDSFNTLSFNTSIDYLFISLLSACSLDPSVCLSSDDFRTMRFATITGNRLVDDLKEGNFQLILLDQKFI